MLTQNFAKKHKPFFLERLFIFSDATFSVSKRLTFRCYEKGRNCYEKKPKLLQNGLGFFIDGIC